MPEATPRWLGILKREWWVVLLTLAVALVVLLSTGSIGGGTVYQATAKVGVETKTLGEYTRVPTVDELLTDVNSEQFRNLTMPELNVPIYQTQGNLRIYSVKVPQTAILVSYNASKSEEALRIAEAVAERVAVRALSMAEEDVSAIQRKIAVLDNALTAFGGTKNNEAEIWPIQLERETLMDDVQLIKEAYKVQPPTEVSQVKSSPTTVLGGLLGGLAAGLAIAAAREALRTRRRTRKARVA